MKDELDLKTLFPIPVDVVEGQNYLWCSCGESSTQPLCDKETCGSKAVEFKAELSETVYFCGCKQTQDPPLCDGSHSKLLLELVKKRQQKGE